MKKQDWLLLAIGESIQPIQLQKTLFKFAKESGVPGTESYRFVPYNWGPCSFDIYDDLHTLREEGYVEAVPTGRGWNSYRQTERGKAMATTLREQANATYAEKLRELRDWVTSRSFETLLKDVYKDYKEYSTESLFTR